MDSSTPQRPVMDVAKPADSHAPAAPKPAGSQAPHAARPQALKPAPANDQAPDKPEAPQTEKPAAAERESKTSDAAKPSAPAGLIVMTVLGMMLLSGLAVVAYVTTQA